MLAEVVEQMWLSAINSAIGNKEMEESNGDAKVASKVQSNTATIVLVSYWPTTTMDTLLPTSPVPESVCCQLAPICNGRPPLSHVQLPSRISRVDSVTLSLNPFKNTQDASMYEGFLAMYDSNDD